MKKILLILAVIIIHNFLFSSFSYCKNNSKQDSLSNSKNLLIKKLNEARINNDNILFESSLLELSQFYIENKETQNAIITLNELFEIYQDEADDLKIINVLEKLEMLNLRLGRIDKCKEYLFDIQKRLLANPDSMRLANNYRRFGKAYERKGELNKALESYFIALSIYEKFNSDSKVAEIYSNMARLLLLNQNYDDAEKYNLRAIEIFKKLNNTFKIIDCYYHLAVNLGEQKKYDRAIDYLNMANDLDLTNDLESQSKITAGYAFIYYQLGNNKKVVEILQNNLKNAIQRDDIWDILAVKANMGDAYSKLGIYNEAEKYLLESNKMAEEMNSEMARSYTTGFLSEHYKRKGNYKLAHEYFIKASDLRDSMYSHERQSFIEELKTRYETDKQETENKILQKEGKLKELEINKQTNLRNSFFVMALLGTILILFSAYQYFIKYKVNKKIKLQKMELEISNSTKDKFFSIISHDLRSPFTALLGYTEMLSRDYGELPEYKTKEYIDSLNETTVRLYKLLENLLNWSRIQTGRITNIPKTLNIYKSVYSIYMLVNNYAQQKNIKIFLSIDNDFEINIDEEMFNTIIRNILGNAIKFTPLNGEVKLFLEKNSDDFSIIIQDTGIGMSENELKKIFKIDQHHSTLGTNNEKGTGLGLILCKEMIEINNGNLIVESEIKNGSKFILRFPNSIIATNVKQPELV